MPPRWHLIMSNEVNVIRYFSFSPSKTQKYMLKDQIESPVGQRVQRTILYFSKRQLSQCQLILERLGEKEQYSERKDKKKFSRIDRKRKNRDKSSKQGIFCFDCGAEDKMEEHDGFTQPSFLIKKRLEEGSNSASAKEDLFVTLRRRLVDPSNVIPKEGISLLRELEALRNSDMPNFRCWRHSELGFKSHHEGSEPHTG